MTLTPQETAFINQQRFAQAARYFEMACQNSRAHDLFAAQMLAKYGSHGADVSGCVRSHFPDHIKEDLRNTARRVTQYSDAAYAARPPYVRRATMVRLARLIATRDGAGFYGPQPYVTLQYGDKRDYRKIDLFDAQGEYIGSTTWSRTCREALAHAPHASTARFAR